VITRSVPRENGGAFRCLLGLGEFEELDGRAVVHDEGDAHTFLRRIGLDDNLVPGDGGFQVIDFEGQVWDIFHEVGQGTVRFEPHPLDAERARFQSRDVHPEVLEVLLVWSYLVGGYAEVVVSLFHRLLSPPVCLLGGESN